MTGVVVGSGLGLFNTSLSLQGEVGLGQADLASYVNARTGNLVVNQADTSLVGLGLDANLLRTYNSQGQLDDDNGDNWRFGYSRLKNVSSGSSITRVSGSGSETVYQYNSSNGRYESTDGAGAHDYMTYSGGVVKWFSDGDTGVSEEFNASGQLLRQKDRDGNITSFAYTGAGLLSTIQTSGQTLRFSYSGTKVTSVRSETFSGNSNTSAMNSTVARYEYDSYGRLSKAIIDLSPENNSVADGKKYQTTYTYDGTSKRVASISQTDGTSVSFTYQLHGGVYKVKTVTHGNGQSMTYNYGLSNSNGTYTQVVNGVGQNWLYFHDSKGQLTRVESPAVSGQRLVTKYSYDAKGNVLTVTDPENKVTTYQYDSRGNRTLERDALGNTVKRTFSSKNQLLTETVYLVADPDGAGSAQPSQPITSRFVYDSEGHLRFALNGEGEVTEYRYQSNGLLSREISYMANSYNVGSLSVTSAPSLSQMSSWVSSANKSLSQLTYHTYDFRGQLASSTVYSDVDSNGNGVSSTAAKTSYVYDYMGRLLQTISPQGNATSTANDYRTQFAYDGMGRLLSSTDAHGVLSSTQYLDSNQKVVTQSANGLYSTSVYDAAGQSISTSQSNSSSSSDNLGKSYLYYDNDGRLRATKGPDGSVSYLFYDTAGRISAEVDGSGSVVEYQRNKRGQIIKTIAYANEVNTSSWLNSSTGVVSQTNLASIRPAAHADDRTSSNTYDNAGRMLTSKDGEGSITTFSYDGVGRVIKSQTGSRYTRTFYDAAGRVTAELDARGALIENIYDQAGQLIKVISYSNFTNTSYRASGSLSQLRPSANANNDIVSRNYYNDRGQLIGQLNAENYLTEFSYDREGNLIQTRQFKNRSTGVSDSASFATVRPANHANDHVSTMQYNQLGQLISETNFEGTTTTYAYDNVGNLVKTQVADRRNYSAYDEKGQLTHTVNGVGSAAIGASASESQIKAKAVTHGTRFIYDLSGRVTQSIDANGHKSLYFYDADGNAAITVAADGGAVVNEYNAFGEVESTRVYATPISLSGLNGGAINSTLLSRLAAAKDDAVDTYTEFKFNARGQLKETLRQILDSAGSANWYKTSHNYDSYGQKSSTTEQINFSADNRYTEFVYNENGQITAIKKAPSTAHAQTITSSFDAFGRVVAVTDARGNSSDSVYDRLGRLIEFNDAHGETSVSFYDAFNRLISKEDTLGNETVYHYNDSTKTLFIEHPHLTTQITHNAHGEKVLVQDGNGNETSFQYDLNGHLVEQENGTGNVQDFIYNAAGQLIQSFDARGVKTEISYDPVGRVLSKVIDPNGLALTSSTTYDAKGQLLTSTDPRGVVTQTRYNSLGQVVEVIKDFGGLNISTQFEYNGLGNQVRVINAAGTASQQVIEYVYDKLGRRVETIQDPDGLALSNKTEYDKNDNAIKSIDAKGVVSTYQYDATNRLVKTITDATGLNVITQTSYDSEDRVYQTVDGKGVVTRFEYTEDGLLKKQIKDFGGLNQVTSYDYDGNNNRIRMTDGRGVKTRYYYDEANQIYRTVRDEGGLNISTYSYYDGNGNLVRSKDGRGNITHFVYDNANRLKFTVNPNNYVTESIYDAAGNLIEKRQYHHAVGSNGNWTETNLTQALKGESSASVNETFTNLNNSAFNYSAIGSSQNTITHSNGALLFTNANASAEQRYSISRNQGHSLADNVTTRFEITGDNIAQSLDFQAMLTNASGSFYHGISIYNEQEIIIPDPDPVDPDPIDPDPVDPDPNDPIGPIKVPLELQEKNLLLDTTDITSNKNLSIGDRLMVSIINSAGESVFTRLSISEDTTYVVEIKTNSEGSTLYFYAKDNTSSLIVFKHHLSGASDTTGELHFEASTRVSPLISSTETVRGTIALDNYSEQKQAVAYSEQHYAYDALGRNTYSSDGEGFVTKNTYDSSGNLIKSERFDKAVNQQGLVNEHSFEIALRSVWQQDFSEGTSPLSDHFSSHPDLVSYEGEHLLFTTGYRATNTWPGVWTALQSYSQGIGYSAEVTTGDVHDKEYLMVAIDNGKSWSDPAYRFHGGYFTNGNITGYNRQNVASSSQQFSQVKSNTTYVVELETQADKTVLFVYEKGSNRNQGWSQEFSSVNWDNIKFRVYTHGGPANVGRQFKVDNLIEYRVNGSLPDSSKTEYSYDAAGRLSFSKDGLGHLTEYKYDANNNLIENIKYQGSTATGAQISSRFYYNNLDQLVYSVDPLGHATQNFYDKAGSLIGTRTYASNLSTAAQASFASVEAALFSNSTSADYKGNQYIYNHLGQLRFSIDSLGYVTESVLDDNGNVTATKKYDKAINGEAVQTEADVYRELRTTWSQDFNDGFSGVGHNASSHPSLVYRENGQVALDKGVHATNTWPGIYRSHAAYASGKGYRMEVTTKDLGGEYLTVAVDNSQSYSSTAFKRHGIHFANGNIYAYQRHNAVSSTPLLGAAKENTTYVVEVETSSSGTKVYVYEKGSERADGYSHTLNSSGWGNIRLRAYTFGGPGVVGEPLYLDNMSEYSVSGALPSYQQTSYGYDKLNRVTSSTDGLNNTESYTYDANGNRLSLTNKKGHVWNYNYDKNNQLTEELSPAVTNYYRATSSSTSLLSTSARLKKVFSYDYKGQTTSITEAAGTDWERKVEYEYNDNGYQVKTTHPKAGYSQTSNHVFYDAYGLAVVNKDVGGKYSYKTYNKNQQVEFEIDALGYVTKHEYDSFGNEVKVTRYANAINISNQAEQAYSSSEVAGLISHNSAQDRSISMTYDASNRQTKVVQSSENSYFKAASVGGSNYSTTPETRFVYDAYGNVIKQSVKINSTEFADSYFYYDEANRKVASIDSEGYLIKNEYDDYGNLLKVTEFARKVSVPANHVIPADPAQGTDVLGFNRVTHYQYDSMNRQVAVIRDDTNSGQSNVLSQVSYDQVGNVLSTTNVLGQTSTNTFDALGRTTKVTASPRTVANSYTNAFSSINVTPTIQLYLDVHGNVLRESKNSGQHSFANNRTTNNYYDEQGKLSKTVDANGSALNYTYDAFGRVTQTSQTVSESFYDWSSGNYNYTKKISYAYDATGQQILTTTDATVNGSSSKKITQKSYYNGFGEQIRATIKDSYSQEYELTTYSYDKNGNLVSSRERGIDKNFYYDLQGKVTKQTVEGQQTTINQYDKRGHLLRQQLPTFTGSLTSSILKKPVVEQAFDAWGNVIQVTEKREGDSGVYDAVTTLKYNNDNKVVLKIEPEVAYMNDLGQTTNAQGTLKVTPTTSYKYNAAGLLTEITDARGNTRYQIYNSTGNLVEQRDTLNNSTYFAYNAFDEKVATKNAIGTVTTEHFDKLGNVIKSGIIRNGSEVTLKIFGYDQLGNRTSTLRYFSNGSSAKDYVKYDQNGQVIKTRNGAGLELHYRYDMLGNKTYESDGNTRNYSTGFKSKTWTYDIATGRLSAHTDLKNRVYSYNYNALGQVVQDKIKYNNQELQRRDYQYYNNGLVKSIVQSVPDSQVVADYYTQSNIVDYQVNYTESSSFEYDIANNKTKEKHHTNRDTQITIEHYVNHFWFNHVYTTNVNDSFTIDREVNYKFDALNRLINVSSPQSSQVQNGVSKNTTGINYLNYKYDENGNRRYVDAHYRKRNTTSSTTVRHYYTYDKMNKMLISQGTYGGNISEGKGTRLSYNALGQRVTAETFDDRNAYFGQRTILHNGQYASREVRGDKYTQELYSYNDLGQMSEVKKRTNWRNLDYKVVVTSGGNGFEEPLDPYANKTTLLESSKETTALRLPIDDGGDGGGGGSGGTSTTYWYNYKNEELGGYGLQNQKSYDNQGRLIENIEYNFGSRKSHSTYQYFGDDRIKVQTQFKRHNGIDYQEAKTRYDFAGAYDLAGNLTAYKVEVNHENSFNYHYTTDYTKQYEGFENYKEAVATVTTGLNNYQPGTVTSKYDALGNLMRVRGQGGENGTFNREFVYSREGNILYRIEGSLGQDYYHYKNNQIGSAGEILDADFDYNFQAVSSSYPAATPSGYTVNNGDTLRSIAQAVYGDGSLWYEIADANSLQNDSDLSQGQRLVVPNVVSNVHNNSETFKPFNFEDTIGNTTPDLNFVPPPPPKKGCGILAIILIVVVAVVATIVTAGAAAAAVGATAASGGTGLFSLGAAALSGGLVGAAGTATIGSIAIGIGAAAIGGAVGSAAGQLTGMALGVQDEFSWRDVAIGGITSAVGSGIGAASQALHSAKWVGEVGSKGHFWRQAAVSSSTAVVTQAANYGVNQLMGNKSKFNWASLATTALTAPLTAAVGNIGSAKTGEEAKWGDKFFGQFGKKFVSGTITSVAQQVFAKNGKYEWSSVAADAFGNAVADSIKAKMISSEETRKQKVEAEKQSAAFAQELDNATLKDANGNPILLASTDNSIIYEILEANSVLLEAKDHESVTHEALSSLKLSSEEIEQIYAGNWLADVSQVIDDTVIVPFAKAHFERDGNNVSLYEALGFNVQETSSGTFISGGKLKGRLPISEAALSSVVHNAEADRIKSALVKGIQLEFKAKFSSLSNYNLTAETIGQYHHTRHGDNPSTDLLNTVDGVSEHMIETATFAKKKFKNAINAGNSIEGRLALGAALHVIQDLPAHSNMMELILKQEVNSDVQTFTTDGIFTSGTFSMEQGDVVKSLAPMVTDMLAGLGYKGHTDGGSPLARVLLKEFAPEYSSTYETIVETSDAINEYTGPVKDFVIEPISKVKDVVFDGPINVISDELTLSMKDLQNFSGVPTHSQLAKDHDKHPLHNLAKEVAIKDTRELTQMVMDRWSKTTHSNKFINKHVDTMFTHPNKGGLDSTKEMVTKWGNTHTETVKQLTFKKHTEYRMQQIKDAIPQSWKNWWEKQ